MTGKTTFQYASTFGIAGETIVASLGTANNSTRRTLLITDLKASCGGTGRTITIIGRGPDTLPKGLEFDMPANSFLNMSWVNPFRISLTSTTGTSSGIIASASGIGVKYAISGYIED